MKNRGMPPLHLVAARKNKRGVSPIIATILLVAITVVIAAVLYVLVSGYIGGAGSAPKSIELANPSGASGTTTVPTGCTFTGSGSPAKDYADAFSSVTANGGLTTAQFGFKIVATAGTPVVLDCVVLYDASNTPKAVYTPSSTSWSTTVTVQNSYSATFYFATDPTGTGDTIQAFGLGSNSVSGGYSSGL